MEMVVAMGIDLVGRGAGLKKQKLEIKGGFKRYPKMMRPGHRRQPGKTIPLKPRFGRVVLNDSEDAGVYREKVDVDAVMAEHFVGEDHIEQYPHGHDPFAEGETALQHKVVFRPNKAQIRLESTRKHLKSVNMDAKVNGQGPVHHEKKFLPKNANYVAERTKPDLSSHVIHERPILQKRGGTIELQPGYAYDYIEEPVDQDLRHPRVSKSVQEVPSYAATIDLNEDVEFDPQDPAYEQHRRSQALEENVLATAHFDYDPQEQGDFQTRHRRHQVEAYDVTNPDVDYNPGAHDDYYSEQHQRRRQSEASLDAQPVYQNIGVEEDYYPEQHQRRRQSEASLDAPPIYQNTGVEEDYYPEQRQRRHQPETTVDAPPVFNATRDREDYVQQDKNRRKHQNSAVEDALPVFQNIETEADELEYYARQRRKQVEVEQEWASPAFDQVRSERDRNISLRSRRQEGDEHRDQQAEENWDYSDRADVEYEDQHRPRHAGRNQPEYAQDEWDAGSMHDIDSHTTKQSRKHHAQPENVYPEMVEVDVDVDGGYDDTVRVRRPRKVQVEPENMAEALEYYEVPAQVEVEPVRASRRKQHTREVQAPVAEHIEEEVRVPREKPAKSKDPQRKVKSDHRDRKQLSLAKAARETDYAFELEPDSRDPAKMPNMRPKKQQAEPAVMVSIKSFYSDVANRQLEVVASPRRRAVVQPVKTNALLNATGSAKDSQRDQQHRQRSAQPELETKAVQDVNDETPETTLQLHAVKQGNQNAVDVFDYDAGAGIQDPFERPGGSDPEFLKSTDSKKHLARPAAMHTTSEYNTGDEVLDHSGLDSGRRARVPILQPELKAPGNKPVRLRRIPKHDPATSVH
jgi:hypothetical protein